MWGLCPAVVTPAGRGTAGMRGSVRQGRERKRGSVLAVRDSGEGGAIRRKSLLEGTEECTEQICLVPEKVNYKTKKEDGIGKKKGE